MSNKLITLPEANKTLTAALLVASVAAPFLLSAANAFGADDQSNTEVIYGDDDRRQVFDPSVDHAWAELAQSTAALLFKAQVKPDATDPGVSLLPGDKMGQSAHLCAEEPFGDEPNPAFCSGFLVAEDVLVTAGHCATTQAECETIAFVFGFDGSADGHDVTKVATKDVYSCKRLIAQSQNSPTQTDYAIIQLDRKVLGRAPLKFRKEGKIGDHDGVTVIGHPVGLPTKIASNAAVRKNDAGAFFVANLDTYGGNSGSAVFNTQSHEVEGILVRGENDFITKPGDTCMISNRCAADGCRGEDSTRATEFAPFIPDASQPEVPTIDHDYARHDLNLPVPDNDPHGVTVEIVAADQGTLESVVVHVKAHHTYVGDLVITLVHPDGTEVVLSDRQGGHDQVLDKVFGGGGLMVPGLLHLKGKEASGTWKLVVKDTAEQDTGGLDDVTLTTKIRAP